VVVFGPSSAPSFVSLPDVKALCSFLSSPFYLHWTTASGGVINFVYSVLLSRGLERMRADMDDPAIPLVARFGHCSQDLVNLMLCGEAATNVFDGTKSLADNLEDPSAFFLHGVPLQGDVGLLTLMEALKYTKVGSYYKIPKLPIWVVASSSHYTVLFGLDPRINRVSQREERDTKMKIYFQQLDPHEQGFIPADELGTLLKSLQLGVDLDVYDFRRLCDPDNVGVVIWENFKNAITQALDAPPSYWACTACTFQNPRKNARCEICYGPAPAVPSAQHVRFGAISDSSNRQNEAPSTFWLYHFNGILNHSKVQADCKRVRVTNLGDGVEMDGATFNQGLREVIQTRWPGAIVDYMNGEPRIA